MHCEIKITNDGSQTIYVPELNEHYHSIYGAYTESMHVFIKNGLKEIFKKTPEIISILEIGLGTGLNTLLTITETIPTTKKVLYTALEPFPLDEEIITQINYVDLFPGIGISNWFVDMHHSGFNKNIALTNNFSFIKYQQRLEDIIFERSFDLIYFDAFGPGVQNDIWCLENFQKIYQATNENGILVTYCSKGDVRRNMIAAGFIVEKLHGPPGKREMLRALKN
jgi:tRNA U34 5-methylaminomethyl-2-thiouridine-forming methyltransferase MnmC